MIHHGWLALRASQPEHNLLGDIMSTLTGSISEAPNAYARREYAQASDKASMFRIPANRHDEFITRDQQLWCTPVPSTQSDPDRVILVLTDRDEHGNKIVREAHASDLDLLEWLNACLENERELIRELGGIS